MSIYSRIYDTAHVLKFWHKIQKRKAFRHVPLIGTIVARIVAITLKQHLRWWGNPHNFAKKLQPKQDDRDAPVPFLHYSSLAKINQQAQLTTFTTFTTLWQRCVNKWSYWESNLSFFSMNMQFYESIYHFMLSYCSFKIGDKLSFAELWESRKRV